MNEQPYLLPPVELEQIVAALQYLAGVCDGAVEQDGVGFNGLDTRYGKEMAVIGMGMSAGQAVAVSKMLQKYRGQIEGAGLTLPTEQKLTVAVEQNLPRPQDYITLQNQRVMAYFKKVPSEEVRYKMKRIEGWRWERELLGKPWTFPARKILAVLKLLNTHPVDRLTQELADYAATQVDPSKPPEDLIKLTAHDHRILVDFPGTGKPPQEDIDKVKSISGRQWEKDLPGLPWSVPAIQVQQLVELFPDAYMDETVHQLLDQQTQLRELSRAEESGFRVAGLNTEYGTPRPYQWAAMEFMELRNGRALIADDQGLGKCLETLGYFQLHPELRPALIISPSSVKSVWKREEIKWLTTQDTVEILKGQTPYATRASVLIINYDILHHWADYLRQEVKPKLVVADESHYLKNPESKRTKAAFKIVLGKERQKKRDRWSYTSQPVNHFLALTGTPITNRPIDLWTTLHLLDEKTWSSKFRFAKDYGMAYQGHWGWCYDGKPDVERLNRDIAPYVLRRKKSDVLKELPTKMHMPLPLELSVEYKVKYATEYLRVQREIKALQDAHKPVGAKHLGLIETLKQITAEGKMATLTDWISDVLQNEKLIVFCTHTATIDHLMTKFAGQAVEISGRVPAGPKRDAAEHAFMHDPEIKLCAANIVAGGVGLTLTSASKALFAEFPWNPKELDQAADRIHRIGQTEQVMIYYACAADTIDETIVDLLVSKAHVIDQIMDGEAVDDLSIIKEVVERFLAEGTQIEMEIKDGNYSTNQRTD